MLYTGTVLVMEARRRGGVHLRQLPAMLVGNPALPALVAGVAVNLGGLALPDGAFTFLRFAGQAAAPVSLFALGVVLSALASPAIGPLVALVAVAKLVAHPVALFLAFGAAGVGPDWSAPLLVAAAGPSGAMPFVIALQYGVATETIAKAVLVSTVLSLFTLAALTQTLPG